MQRRLWIDTDLGCDDAVAILLALHTRAREIVGFSTVFGNVNVDQAVYNTNKLLEFSNVKGIPVYKGAGTCLNVKEKSIVTSWPGHGVDGLGGFVGAVAEKVDTETPGVEEMVKVLKEGNLDVVLLGPLTNLALAMQMDERVVKGNQFYILGGTHTGPGNITPKAEFNIAADPEAADIVLKGLPDCTLITWDVCIKYPMSWAFYDQLVAYGTKNADFLQSILKSYVEHVRDRDVIHGQESELVLADVYAIMAALHPKEFIQKSTIASGFVELTPGPNRGFTDFTANVNCNKVHIVTDIDVQFLKNSLAQWCADAPQPHVL